jgi:taurine dioxygenase
MPLLSEFQVFKGPSFPCKSSPRPTSFPQRLSLYIESEYPAQPYTGSQRNTPKMARMLSEVELNEPFKTIGVTPSGATLGADIEGVDFGDLKPGQLAEITRAMSLHRVVRFRGMRLVTDYQQLAFAYLIGKPTMHVEQLKGTHGYHGEFEEIMKISNQKGEGALGDSEILWHTDMYTDTIPPGPTILKALKAECTGGNTHFANTGKIYDDLPESCKALLRGRQIQFDVVWYPDGSHRPGQTEPETDDKRLWPYVRHPLVRTDRATGRNSLYLGAEANRGAWIVGLPVKQSNDILEMLWNMVRDTKYHWVQEWKEGDMIMWDNRLVLHYRSEMGKGERLMHRIAIEGDKPVFIM